jgi:iron complex transport system ATP-binding protein
MNAPILSFERVSFGYLRAQKPILRDLSLVFEPGSATAILGPNGAGKTTLLYLALGWLRPWEGKVLIEGKVLGNFTRRDLGQRMALIPQMEHTPFEYSVLEYVMLGRAPYIAPLGMPADEDYEAAFHALELAGIAELYDHPILNLSGGERQLVLAARALAQQPRILLLDEPTSHLDLGNKVHMIQILKALQAQGVTILMTTHEPDLALAIARNVILMEKGRVLTSGPVNEVMTSQNLSQTYGLRVRVVEVEGRKQVIWL